MIKALDQFLCKIVPFKKICYDLHCLWNRLLSQRKKAGGITASTAL